MHRSLACLAALTLPLTFTACAAPREGDALDAAAAADDAGPIAPDGAVAPPDGAPAPDAAAPITIDDRGIPPEAALYTVDRARHGIRDLGAVLAQRLGPGVDNVILYVHGRGCGGGGEPQKSLDGALPALARDYTALAIMLFWPGSDDGCPAGFPDARALAAGPALAVVLGDLYAYQQAHPAAFAGVRVTLVTHSMGSLVLERAVTVAGVGQLPPVVDALIVNAGASAAAGHAAWVARTTFARDRYVTVNSGDNVLLAAGVGRPARLGRGVDDVPLAAGLSYVDFSANDVNHAYYLVDGQKGAAMKAFYRQVMNGLPYDLAGSPGVGSHVARDGATIHRFNGQ